MQGLISSSKCTVWNGTESGTAAYTAASIKRENKVHRRLSKRLINHLMCAFIPNRQLPNALGCSIVNQD